jgi:ubiquinone/menaquinone biosynthesis C-methylase UbiE
MTKDYEKLSATYYDGVADNFDKTFDGFLSSFFKRYIKKHLSLKPTDNLLDVGSANGTLLGMLKPAHGTGLEISPEMVQVASRNHPDYTFVNGSALQMPFEDNTFDVVTCSASFHHFPTPEHFMQEAKRVLKPGGRLVIAEIRIPIFHDLYNWYIATFNTEGDVQVYRNRELVELYEAAGFKVETNQTNGLQIQYLEGVK